MVSVGVTPSFFFFLIIHKKVKSSQFQGGFTVYSLYLRTCLLVPSFNSYLFLTHDKTVLQFLARAWFERNF